MFSSLYLYLRQHEILVVYFRKYNSIVALVIDIFSLSIINFFYNWDCFKIRSTLIYLSNHPLLLTTSSQPDLIAVVSLLVSTSLCQPNASRLPLPPSFSTRFIIVISKYVAIPPPCLFSTMRCRILNRYPQPSN